MHMQRVFVVLTVLFVLTFTLDGGHVVQAAESGEVPLHFPDSALEKAIRGRLAESDWPLYPSNADLVDRLFVEWPDDDERIGSLDGLDGLTDLMYLVLTGHDIDDVVPLAGITSLISINLRQNRIRDISALAGLVQLDTLDVTANEIDDLTGLAGLSNLQYLYVGENNVRDLSPLAGAMQLERLTVHRNDLRDIAALADLPSLRQVTLYGNPALDLCAGTPDRRLVDDLLARGAEVLYDERAAGDLACPDVAAVGPVQINKHLGDGDETLIVQGGQIARLNPDQTRVLAMCRGTARTVTFVNDAQGVYWTGPLQQFVADLNQFIVIHLLPNDPHVQYAVDVRVSEHGVETVAGYSAQRYRVDWRPHPDEGGDGASWQPLQELWIASGVTDELAMSGCNDVVSFLEILQLFQGAFTSQRYYGLAQSMEYAEIAMSGYPVKVQLYDTAGEPVAPFEVRSVSKEPAPDDAFRLSEALVEVDSIAHVFN